MSLFGGSWTTASLLTTTKIAVPGIIGGAALGVLLKAAIKNVGPLVLEATTSKLPEDVRDEMRASYAAAASGNLDEYFTHTKEATSRLAEKLNTRKPVSNNA